MRNSTQTGDITLVVINAGEADMQKNWSTIRGLIGASAMLMIATGAVVRILIESNVGGSSSSNSCSSSSCRWSSRKMQ